MRMRRKKNVDSRISACGDMLMVYESDDLSYSNKGDGSELLDLKAIFGNKNRIEMEIGCGKGRFITELASRNPDVNYIAVEKSDNIIVQACESALNNGLKNVFFICSYAEYLPRIIERGAVDTIYLNFSCPFPKKSHETHRLTHRNYLKIYRELLSSSGRVYQKTDNMALFEFSLEQFSAEGYILDKVFLDLHNSDVEGNIMTEYEERFSKTGKSIYYLQAHPKPH